MADNYINLPVEGTGGGGSGVTSLNGLTGALALVAGSGIAITPVGLTLVIASTNGLNSIGTFDSQAKAANGLVLVGNVLYAQSADATHPGMLSIGSQTIAGNKTFTGSISASNLSGTNTGDITIGTANGLSVLGQALSLGLSSTSTTGALSSTDWNTFNSKQSSGNYITALTGDVTASGPGSAVSTITNLAVTNAKIANSTINLTTKVTGVLPVANGGTGLGTTPGNGEILIGNGTNYTKNTITAGTGIIVTNAAGSITIVNSAATGSINIDGGQANSNYGGIAPINAGGA